MRNILISLLALLTSATAFAAGGVPNMINYYNMILHELDLGHEWMPTVGSLTVTLVVIGVGFYFKSAIQKDAGDIVPNGKFSLRYLLEVILEFVYSIGKDNCGDNYRKYLPILSALFVFILFCNLSGLVPGFPPPTENMSHNVAMGLVAFLVYNYAGYKEHGFGYIKTFMGPVLAIAPLIFVIELISHASRPLSLGLRLTGNIFGDHILLGVMTGLAKLVVPSALMFFGLLVAVMQSFVFTLLTALYISMAVSHDH